MNISDFGLGRHDDFLRSMPRVGMLDRAAMRMIQPEVGLFSSRMIYTFKDTDVVSSAEDSLTKALLESNERNEAGMKLLKTTGKYPTGFLTYTNGTIYRFQSEKNGGYIDFDFIGSDSAMCHILIVFLMTHRQGNFFNSKDFIINRFAKTIFDLKGFDISTIAGTAMANQFPIRHKRDWRELKKDGTTKLVRLYELMNFQRVDDDSNFVCLHRSKVNQKRVKTYATPKEPIQQPHPITVAPVCADFVI